MKNDPPFPSDTKNRILEAAGEVFDDYLNMLVAEKNIDAKVKVIEQA